MSNTTVKNTLDYSIFQNYTTNRDVRMGHVADLVNSIETRNLLYTQPITVNEEYFVIDGQHRLAAAKSLGLPIYYIVCPGLTERDIPRLNSVMKLWLMADYLDHYVGLGL